MEIDFVNNKYSEGFIRDCVNNNKLNARQFRLISEYQILSESFIRTFEHKVIWVYISRYQELSENFIREFKHKVNCTWMCQYQQLSINFINEMIQEGFIKEMHIKFLLQNKHINQEELQIYLSL